MQRPPAIATWSRSVRRSIVDRMRAGEAAGVNRGLMLIDPDFGFGTTFARPHTSRRAAAVHSARIVVEICQMGVLAAFTGRPVQRRVIGSVAAALIAIKRRAIVVRAHDGVSQRTASAFVACDRREYGHDQRF